MSNEGTLNSRFLLRYADREIGRYLVVVPHTNVPDIHSLPPNCASSIEWHSRLSFNIQVLGKTTYFPQESKQINQCRGLGTDFSWIRNVWRNKTKSFFYLKTIRKCVQEKIATFSYSRDPIFRVRLNFQSVQVSNQAVKRCECFFTSQISIFSTVLYSCHRKTESCGENASTASIIVKVLKVCKVVSAQISNTCNVLHRSLVLKSKI